MAQISISCSDSRGTLVDRQTTQVEDLLEACDYATAMAHSLIATRIGVAVGSMFTTIWAWKY